MSSVSEPFGITPLEALRNGTPILISKQSGVSEVVSHALKCDFWDINQMANQMLAVIQYPSLQADLTENGLNEVMGFSWNTAAANCVSVYNSVLSTR